MNWALSQETDACIDWPFSKNNRGYGHYKKDGYNLAHQYVCAKAHGPRPKGKDAAHRCGHRSCVNKRHLSWKTRKHNHEDKVKHGTHLRGENSPACKVTSLQVAEIIDRKGEPLKKLSVEYGVHPSMISRIQNGKKRTFG